MQKFSTHTGVGVPLRRSNVDTDQIIPAVYLKRVTRTGFEDGLFAAWRNDPGFVLNQEPYRTGSVLVAGADFGTGSSREHAVWALKDYGFTAVLSSRFADIFRGNAGKQGLLAAVVEQDDIERLWAVLETRPGSELTVDLNARTVSVERVAEPGSAAPEGRSGAGSGATEALTVGFAVDDYTRWRLLEGLDDIGLTLQHVDQVDDFEKSRPKFLPTTQPARRPA